MSRKFRHSIRFKLLLVSLTLVTIPWAGYRYIQETENFLRSAQETMLLGTAQAVAAILHNREEVFSTSHGSNTATHGDFLYVHPIRGQIHLDGYREDWTPYLPNLWRFGESTGQGLGVLVGERGNHLYLLIEVSDDSIVYQRPDDPGSGRADHIELKLENLQGELRRYRIGTQAPGWVNAVRIDNSGRTLSTETRIKGEWQENSKGYTVELRIPRYLSGDRLSISSGDVDDPVSRRLTARTNHHDGRPGLLVRPDPRIEELIGGLEHENARIWVVDHNLSVLARRGNLVSPQQPEQPGSPFITALLQLVLEQPSTEFSDPFSGRSRLSGDEIKSALQDQPGTRWRPTPDRKATILTATWPIRTTAGVAGAVVVEQSANRILTLQNSAMEELFGITFMLFVGTVVILLLFATLLTRRISQLRNRVEEAVTPDGRVQGRLKADQRRDEIGDLNRSFSGVLDRLAEYNRYLESMASRLAHELRTPLTIVKSSLENLQSESNEQQREQYIHRALDGSERLGLILHRMREATRLEQLLQSAEFERFDLNALAQAATDGYRTAFPGVEFELSLPDQAAMVQAAPELIGQALDKLVSNAVDFHTPGTPIRIILRLTAPNRLWLAIRNSGPTLPKDMEQELFNSMVSVRKDRGSEPHLGLGLYLVRLIAEFHRGRATAGNLKDNSGVEFGINLPMES